MADDLDDDDNEVRWSLLDRPYAYVIFPLIVVFILVFIAIILYNRRRRRRLMALHGHNWPGGLANRHSQIPTTRRQRARGGRGLHWGATRSQEGLNELGEAPPPYDGKRDGNVREKELRDLESGEGTAAGTHGSTSSHANRPPEYISEPGPAVVRPDTRWG